MRRPGPHFRALATFSTGLALALTVGISTVAAAASTSAPAGRAFPGASGSVAAITGSSMEVQNTFTGQVTVSWTTSTTFTQMVSVAASSVTVGECVTASGSTAKKTKEVKATTITISQPVSGKCTGGFGGPNGGAGATRVAGGGAFPGAGSGGPPRGGTFPGAGSGKPRTFPGGAGRTRLGAPGGFGFASGKVTAVTSSSITVSGFSSASFTPPKRTTKTKGTKIKRPALKTTTAKVAVTSSTKYTESQSAAASALAVGDCVTASGPSDSTGAVAASSIRITSTGAKSCNAGFAAFSG